MALYLHEDDRGPAEMLATITIVGLVGAVCFSVGLFVGMIVAQNDAELLGRDCAPTVTKQHGARR